MDPTPDELLSASSNPGGQDHSGAKLLELRFRLLLFLLCFNFQALPALKYPFFYLSSPQDYTWGSNFCLEMTQEGQDTFLGFT